MSTGAATAMSQSPPSSAFRWAARARRGSWTTTRSVSTIAAHTPVTMPTANSPAPAQGSRRAGDSPATPPSYASRGAPDASARRDLGALLDLQQPMHGDRLGD